MKKNVLILLIVLAMGIAGVLAFSTTRAQGKNYVSDPVYGDNITQEELDVLKEEDQVAPGESSIVIGEEFVIELEENQRTDGF